MARLGSVMNSLNIGIKTAVEHLTKKGVVRELNPNSKLSDTEVRILRDAFSKDKDMKVASERISHQRQVKDKPESVAIDGFGKKKAKKTADKPTAEKPVAEKTITPEPSPEKPTVKVVDKIDLDALSKPKAKAQPSKPVAPAPVSPKTPKSEIKKQEAPKPEAPKKEEVKASSPKPEMVKPNVEKASSVEEPKKSAPKTESPKPETKPIIPAASSPIAKPSNLAPKAIQKETASQVSKPNAPKGNMPQESKIVKPTSKSKTMASTKESPEVEKQPVVAQKTETKIFEPNKAQVTNHITVIGKIDLNAINGSTRPKKKTKEEKNKERRAKLNPTRKTSPAKPGDKTTPGSTATTGVRKKRKRIGGDRVDVSNENTRDNTNRTGTNSTPGSSNSRNYSQHNNNDTRGRKRRRAVPAAPVSEEDVARQVKETLARLQAGKRTKKGVKYRKDKRDANAQRQTDQATKDAQEAKVLKLTEFVTANELATMMNVPVTQIIQICFNLGVVVSINQRLDAETINIVAEELGYRTEFVSAEIANAVTEEEDKEEDLVSRSPIVTVMGHVDHGKTSLLDHIRNANVIAGEAGGITQHIGAYNVKLKGGKSITFLDTPGHEAFTAMRARGAQATDIAIIIIAADDDVMPQTKEAINHATAAGVPIIFAINKIDKPHANPDRIKQSLSTLNYAVEEWGGKYQSQDISAKSGLGVHDLLEKVLLEAEMLDLKANPNRHAVGTIIESSLDKGRGYVATVLVKTGTLRQGDVVVAGTAFGRIKAMFNERNQRIKTAGPSEPAIILGLNGAPQAGDLFNIFENEHEAREIANKREQLAREQSIRTTSHLTLEEIGRRIALGSFQELNVIVKGDVDGSIEALSDSLIKLSTPEIQVNVIHKGVGQISETDIMLAAASNAIIIGFQVRPSVEARRAAEKEEVDIRLYSVIYDAIEQLKDAMEGMLSPDIKEEVNANLEIRQTFKITKVGTIAGCIVKDGKISRHDKVRIIRDGIVMFTGVLASLKREKDDVKDVGMGFECGLNIQGYNDIQEGDLIEAYKEIEVKKKL